jgi:DNA-binding XRE family transcriptional regulator
MKKKFKRVKPDPQPVKALPIVITIEQRKSLRLSLCDRIKHARKEQGFTLKQAAAIFGISEGSMSKYEQGKTALSVDTYVALSKFYGLNSIDLNETI